MGRGELIGLASMLQEGQTLIGLFRTDVVLS